MNVPVHSKILIGNKINMRLQCHIFPKNNIVIYVILDEFMLYELHKNTLQHRSADDDNHSRKLEPLGFRGIYFMEYFIIL